MAGYWPCTFFLFVDGDSVLSITDINNLLCIRMSAYGMLQ